MATGKDLAELLMATAQDLDRAVSLGRAAGIPMPYLDSWEARTAVLRSEAELQNVPRGTSIRKSSSHKANHSRR